MPTIAIDLSEQHAPVNDQFPQPSTPEGRKLHRLTEEQLAFYEENGYVAGVRVLNDAQVEALRRELAELVDPTHDGQELWYEYHSNESGSQNTVLFHALGAWRIRPALHDVLTRELFDRLIRGRSHSFNAARRTVRDSKCWPYPCRNVCMMAM